MLSSFATARDLKSIRPADDFFHDLVGPAINALRASDASTLEGTQAAVRYAI